MHPVDKLLASGNTKVSIPEFRPVHSTDAIAFIRTVSSLRAAKHQLSICLCSAGTAKLRVLTGISTHVRGVDMQPILALDMA